MVDTKSKHVITSFAAPTEEDLAYFASLSLEEQRELVLAEIDKATGDDVAPLTEGFWTSLRAEIEAVGSTDPDA